jgi:hypothetical protein
MLGELAETRRYRAFISYSHADAAAAYRLHRALEQYRVPRRLVGRATSRGSVPRRLSPIFLDRQELAAGTDLSEDIRSAIAGSDAMIVLCSRAARASAWVDREIALFRDQAPNRPILAVLIEGDPTESFPEAMLSGPVPCDPIAADFRRSADGPRLARLKLIAGLTGLELDALIQRDAQRQVRRVTAITFAATLAMLIMAALLVVGIQARREAERQRAEAEGLVEFMLTDLRKQLKKVGRLDVMNAVNRRAVAYYGDVRALASVSDRGLEQRAALLHLLGEDAQTGGDLAHALLWFRSAEAATTAALIRKPDDPNAIFAQAQSAYWIGRIHELRLEWPQADAHYRRYADGAQRLIAIAPTNPDYMMEMGWSALNLGLVTEYGHHDAAAAETLFRRGILWIDRASRARPGDTAILRELANAYGNLADSYNARRLWQQSLDTRWQQYRLYRRLHDSEPGDADKVFRLATAERSVAKLSLRVGEAATAEAMAWSAYRRSRWLTAHDPANAEWRLFDTKVACDLLDIGPHAFEPTSAQLRQRIATAATGFKRENNPALAGISKCVKRVAAAPAAE